MSLPDVHMCEAMVGGLLESGLKPKMGKKFNLLIYYLQECRLYTHHSCLYKTTIKISQAFIVNFPSFGGQLLYWTLTVHAIKRLWQFHHTDHCPRHIKLRRRSPLCHMPVRFFFKIGIAKLSREAFHIFLLLPSIMSKFKLKLRLKMQYNYILKCSPFEWIPQI